MKEKEAEEVGSRCTDCPWRLKPESWDDDRVVRLKEELVADERGCNAWKICVNRCVVWEHERRCWE